MRRRSSVAEKEPRNQTLALHSAHFVPAANIKSSKRDKVSVAGNVAVAAEQAHPFAERNRQ